MLKHLKRLILLASLAAVAGCTNGNGGSIEPAFTSANLAANRLQLAVGTATFSTGQIGLNIMATYRQPNGLSGTLVNTPTFTGPAAFVNSGPPVACSATTNTGTTGPTGAGAGGDAGTNTIKGSPQVPPGVLAQCTTFGTAGGVFSYGFAPVNAGTSGAASFSLYAQPFYPANAAGVTANTWRCGPPACPYPQLTPPAGTFFTGFSEGFMSFAVTPVVGTYSLSLGIQDSNFNTFTTPTVSANMISVAGLPVYPTPNVASFVKDGAGGGTLTFTAPAGLVETEVNLVNLSANGGAASNNFTVVVQTPTAGVYTATFPSTFLGVNNVSQRTLNTGDSFRFILAGLDYPGYEAGPPNNTQLAPTISGANGQADVTLSARSATGTY